MQRTGRLRACSMVRSLAVVALSLITLTGSGMSQDKALVGYWHNWGWPNALTLTSLPTGYDVVNVAFATPTAVFGATMTFTPDPAIYPSPQTFQSDVQTLQSQGKKVLISIGGANDPIHLDSANDVQSFVTSMLAIINTWGFDGLDIDLEGSSLSLIAGDTDFTNPTSPRIINMIAAIQQIVAQQPPSFLLTAAPETAFVQGGYSAYAGIWGAYLPLLHALRNDLDWVQVQHYNTGPMFGRDGQIYTSGTADFHCAMADMLIGGFPVAGGGSFPPFAPEQVAIGVPASPQAAGSGFTPAAAVHDALDLLVLGRGFGGAYALADPDGYPGFRGVMTWSINWDVDAGGAFSSSHRAHLDGLFLDTDVDSVSAALGGTVTFTLNAGVGAAGRIHYLVPTVSGTSPGIPLPGGLTLPINPDPVTAFAAGPGGAIFFPGFLAALDAFGEGTAQMILPPLPSAAGVVMHFAFALPFDFVSPAVRIDVIP